MSETPQLQTVAGRVLRPLARLLIGRGVGFPVASDWLKRAYLAAAARHFRLDGKRLTDSRLSLLTGLQRKDIKALRAGAEAEDRAPAPGGPVARTVALWLAGHAGADGRAALPLRGPAPSFEALSPRSSRDVHPRTIQDELVRLGLAALDGEHVSLTAEAYLPTADPAGLLAYLGANVGDHLDAAAANVLAAPGPGPHYERAVHYNHLTPASAAELDALARHRLTEALGEINARAAALQRRDAGQAGAECRVRIGAYAYAAAQDDRPEGPNPDQETPP